jgi:hypothetical protein
VRLYLTHSHFTGAGKTYTMSGGRQQYKQRGLIPRVLTQLFSEIRGMPGHDVKVSIQYLEVRGGGGGRKYDMAACIKGRAGKGRT